MKNLILPILYAILVLIPVSSHETTRGVFSATANNVKVVNLTCEYRTDPIAVGVYRPRLTWQLTSNQRDVRQLAYRILVSSSREKLAAGNGDVWDSHKIRSRNSLNIVYSGKPLTSRTRYYWKVEVWTNKGTTRWSAPAAWTMGLLNRSDWRAKWIGLNRSFPWDSPDSMRSRLSARYFRKAFSLDSKIRKATVYVSGLGLYKLYINGKKVGREVMAPTLSGYSRRVYYNTYDVTDFLRQGEDAIGVVLGNGRFFSMRPIGGPVPVITNYGFPRMILQLEIKLANGSTKTIVSDGSWKVTADGPIRSDNEYDGEDYDARLEMPGWNNTGFNDSGWLDAQVVKPTCKILEAQPNPNVVIMDSLRPVSMFELKPGAYIFNMGQNMVGWARITARGKPGEKVTLRFAERLNPDSTLYTANLRSAEQTDNYIFKNDREVTWQPSFVYHGFQYVEVTGLSYKPDLNSILGEVVYDRMQTTGSFVTSDSILNRIYKAAYWGIRSNYMGMPTDCPQRDERMGWLGDRATNSYGESFIFGNNLLYSKWLTDITDSQKPDGSLPDVAPPYWKFYTDNMTWPSALILIADHMYRQFGNKRDIADHYEAMRKWLFYMRDKYMKNDLMPKDTYGDWCVPPENRHLIHTKDSTRITPGPFIGSAYFYYCLNLLKRDALLLHKDRDARQYDALAAKVRKAINTTFLNTEKFYYANNTITANLLALYFRIAPKKIRRRVFQNIVEKTENQFHGHIGTGMVGGQWLMRTLTDYGRADLAYKIATNTTYPSWGYMIEHGATTIWELWDGNTANPAMNSGNHVMLLGDLVIWFYQDVAGIEPEFAKPGYSHFIMDPRVIDSLSFVNASYNSVRGLVRSDWNKKDGRFYWKISIPANTTATVYVPAAKGSAVMEGSKPARDSYGVKFLRLEKGRAVYEVGSGNYEFSSTP